MTIFVTQAGAVEAWSRPLALHQSDM